MKNIMLMDTSVTKRTYDATPESMGMSQAEFDASFRGGNHGGPKAKAPTPLDDYVFAKQLGVGLTGSVYKAWRKRGAWSTRGGVGVGNGDGDGDGDETHVAVAVKVMDKVKILDINETAHVVQESRILRSVSSASVHRQHARRVSDPVGDVHRDGVRLRAGPVLHDPRTGRVESVSDASVRRASRASATTSTPRVSSIAT